MTGSIRKRSLSVSIGLLGICSVVVTALVMLAMVLWLSGRYNDLAQKEVDQLIGADLDHITQGVYNLVQTEDEAARHQARRDLDVALYILKASGPLRLSSETVEWTAVNQFSREKKSLTLPRMEIGNRWLGKNRLFSEKSPMCGRGDQTDRGDRHPLPAGERGRGHDPGGHHGGRR